MFKAGDSAAEGKNATSHNKSYQFDGNNGRKGCRWKMKKTRSAQVRTRMSWNSLTTPLACSNFTSYCRLIVITLHRRETPKSKNKIFFLYDYLYIYEK